MTDSTDTTDAIDSEALQWEATVSLAQQQNPDWTWDGCVVCGKAPVRRGVFILPSNGTLGLVAWCDLTECVADRRRSGAYLLPATPVPCQTCGVAS